MTSFQNSLAGAAGFVLVVALGSLAHADAFDCKKTETQSECFTRLKCKAGEEVADCQKRLRAAAANGSSNGGNNGNSGGDDRGNDRGNDRGGDDRGNDRGNDRGGDDRGDRGERRGGGGGERGRRRRGGGGGGGAGFEANKTFGLGLELGEPTGLNGKVFVSPKVALDFGLGYAYHQYYYGDGLHLYGDVLFHPVLLSSGPSVEIPFYVGIGLRYWQFDFYDNNRILYHTDAIGIRVPLGISFDFNNSPLDIFVQVVPTFDFLNDDYYRYYNHRNHFGIDPSVGIRFWFK
jgi:hypothetical protein